MTGWIQNLAEIQKTLEQINVDALTLPPETAASLAKISRQQRELAQTLSQNQEFMEALQSLSEQQAEMAAALQGIDFSDVDTSAVEQIATSEYVVESTEAAENGLSSEVSVEDGLSEEEVQSILETSVLIASAAQLRERSADLGEDEIWLLTVTIAAAITMALSVDGGLGIAALLAEAASRISSND